jgi:hypothetical protein
MWHSVPAAAIAAGLVYWLCSCPEQRTRLCKTGAMALGYIWHLVLDEINSVETTSRGRVRMKRSFGTALKFFSTSPWANISTYAKLIIVVGVIVFDGAAPFAHSHSEEGAQAGTTIDDPYGDGRGEQRYSPVAPPGSYPEDVYRRTVPVQPYAPAYGPPPPTQYPSAESPYRSPYR